MGKQVIQTQMASITSVPKRALVKPLTVSVNMSVTETLKLQPWSLVTGSGLTGVKGKWVSASVSTLTGYVLNRCRNLLPVKGLFSPGENITAPDPRVSEY